LRRLSLAYATDLYVYLYFRRVGVIRARCNVEHLLRIARIAVSGTVDLVFVVAVGWVIDFRVRHVDPRVHRQG